MVSVAVAGGAVAVAGAVRVEFPLARGVAARVPRITWAGRSAWRRGSATLDGSAAKLERQVGFQGLYGNRGAVWPASPRDSRAGRIEGLPSRSTGSHPSVPPKEE